MPDTLARGINPAQTISQYNQGGEMLQEASCSIISDNSWIFDADAIDHMEDMSGIDVHQEDWIAIG